jgi:hypothetical protein
MLRLRNLRRCTLKENMTQPKWLAQIGAAITYVAGKVLPVARAAVRLSTKPDVL